MKKIAVALVVVVIALATPSAHAHGGREAGGIVWVVGWAQEPAYVGVANAVQVTLTVGGVPVDGAEGGLKVEVSLGDESFGPLDLVPEPDAPGEYRATLIPTVPGDYSFRFVGAVGGSMVDESFTASEDGFDLVRTTVDVAFPKAAPSASELSDRIDGVEADAAGRDPLALLAFAVSIVALVLAVRGRRSA